MSATQPTPQRPEPSTALALQQARMLQTTVNAREDADSFDDDELDLRALFRTLLKHKWMIGGITLLALAAAAVYTLRITPLYRSTALIQIDQATQKVVGFNTEVELDQGSAADQLQLRTQIELLKSRSLALRVIDELGLYRPVARPPGQVQGQPDASASKEASPGAQMAPVSAGDSSTEGETPNFLQTLQSNFTQLFTPASQDEQKMGRNATVSAFFQAVSIEPVRNSRLVEVQVLNKDPELAARIANQIGQTFIAMNLERKLESSVYARQFLEEQIQQTKAKLEESERVINQYAKSNQILNLGDKTSATTQNYVDFSAALAKAEQDRIEAEALYNQVRLRPESAPQVLSNVAMQSYKAELAKMEAAYAKNLSTYKPDFPAMLEAKAEIDKLQARLNAEVQITLESLKAQADAAREREAALRARVATSRQEVITVQDRSVDMNLLQRELDTNRQVYDSLLQRLKEVSVTGGLTTNNISVVDEAEAALSPYQPRPVINLGLGLLVGLFLGVVAALLREQMDDSIKHADEIDKQLGLPLLGLIPFTKKPKELPGESVALLAHTDPRSGFAEAYRSMRTALQFSTTEGAPRRFMVTSCGKAEGKTTTALALAINFAQLGQQVLLIDADMRKPALHRALGLPNERGLSNLLAGDVASEALIAPTLVPNLSVMTSGPTPPDPVELLMGPKFLLLLDRAADMGFAQVIIDGPPLLGIADSIVLGNQVQHMVFTVKASGTRRNSIRDALRRMKVAGIAPMGVVLTHARNEHSSDYAYEGYYGYGDPQLAAPATRPPPDSRPPDSRPPNTRPARA